MISRAAERKRRLEATFEAGAAERRNRPTGLIVAAVVLLLLAFIYLTYASTQRREAAVGLAAARASLQSLVDLEAEIEAFQDDAAQSELRRRYSPLMSRIRSRLETLARNVGLDDPLPQLGQISGERRLGLDSPLLLRTISATIPEGDPELVLEWIQVATERIDGLFVSGVSLSPVAGGWRITVQLSRWEIDQ